MSRPQQQVLGALILAGLVAAVGIGLQRARTESANRTVGLTADYTDLQRLSALSDLPLPELLAELRATGVTHVAISELSVDELRAQRPYLTPALLPEATRATLRAKLPGRAWEQDLTGRALMALAVAFKDLGVGYDAAAVEAVQAAGLGVVARPRPDYASAREAIAASVQAAEQTGARVVVFTGTQVLGNRDLLRVTARELGNRGMLWGWVELVPQQGAGGLARALESRVVRVHSITEVELAERMTPGTATDRFALAVTERKVRLCYVRAFFDRGEAWPANRAYFAALAERLTEAGFELGEPQAHTAPTTGPVLRIALLLAVGAAALWLVQMLVGLRAAWFWALLGLMVAGAVLEGLAGLKASASAAALLAALVFPVLGMLGLRWPERSRRGAAGRAAVAFVGLCALTAAGALIAAALLSDLPHLMGVELFKGVKLAHALPLLLVAVVTVARSMPHYREARLELGEHYSELPALRVGLGQALGLAVRYGQAVLAVAAFGALALMMLRSGNEPPVGVSGWERQMRALLDEVLGVRPRTKEIFFGHPLLVLTLVLLYGGWRRGIWLGFTAGAVGQISLFNTFCHLHTPLEISLLRAAHGAWIGLLIGLAVWVLVAGLGRVLRRGGGCPLISPEPDPDRPPPRPAARSD